MRLDSNQELNKIGTPFITIRDSQYLFVVKIEDSHILYYVNNKLIREPLDSFGLNWSRIAICLKLEEYNGEPNYKKNRITTNVSYLLRFATIICIASTLAHLYITNYLDIPNIITLLVCIIGALCCFHFYFLPKTKISLCNILSKSFCNIRHKYIYGIDISDLGLSYFITISTYILIYPTKCGAIAYSLTFAIIEVIWSAYAQIRAKQFCLNCTTIQIFIIALPFLIINTPHNMDVSAKHIILFCLIYFSILWFVENYIRTKYNLLHSNRYIKAVGSNVKRNYLSLLQHSNQDLLQNDSDSNNNNANIIYLFLNPFCEPCKEEFLSVFNLIANKTLIINPILIYNDKKGKEIVEIILTLSKSHNQLNVLYDWYNYGYKNVSKFMSNYNIFVPDEDSKEELSTNQTMLTKYSITATPAIIYMNKRLPNYFSIIDIFNS